MNQEHLINLFQNKKYTDVKVIATEFNCESNNIKFNVHKSILCTICPYFESYFNFTKENLSEITIPIFNPHILYDVVASFYHVAQNSSNLSESEHLLEIIRCCDYLSLDNKENLTKLCTLTIPKINFDLLLEIINIVDHADNPDDKVVRLVYDNFPEGYDLSKIKHSLKNKLLNHRDSKIIYRDDEDVIVKKYSFFDEIPKNKIELKRHIPTNLFGMITFSNDSEKYIVQHNNKICVSNFETGELLYEIPYQGWLSNIIISSDNTKMIVNDGQTMICVYDFISGNLIRTLFSQFGNVHQILMSTDGTKIFIMSRKFMVIWDYHADQLLTIKELHDDHIIRIFFLEDNKIISVSNNKKIKIWDINFMLINTINIISNSTYDDVSLSKDNKKIIISCSDYSIQIWDISTGKLITTLKGHTNTVEFLPNTFISKELNANYFSDYGTLISFGYDNIIKLWDITTGKMISSINLCDLITIDRRRIRLNCVQFVHYANKLVGLPQ